MRYHASTFRVLGSESGTSVAAEVALNEVENRLGIVLPPSVRQWYALQDGIKILAEHSNEDPPIPPENFSVIEWQSRKLLPIRHENQGVCMWAIVLDGTEDPPVYVDVDSGGKLWQPLAPSFSAYVYSCVWDYRLVFKQPALVQAQNGIFSRSALDGLTASWNVELQTHGWPGSTQCRFAKERAAILIWSSKDQADWFIASPDECTLESVLCAVWDLDSVGRSLYGCSAMGEAVLEKLARSQP